jgi:hypothetical protein
MSLSNSIVYSVAGLAAMSLWIHKTSDYNRYKVVSNGKSVFVFDQKVGILNRCDTNTCTFVSAAMPQSATDTEMRQIEKVILPPLKPTSSLSVLPGSISVQPKSSSKIVVPAATPVEEEEAAAPPSKKSKASSVSTNSDADDSTAASASTNQAAAQDDDV